MRRILLLSVAFFALILIIARLNGVSSQTNFFDFIVPQEEERVLMLPDVVPTTPLTLFIRTSGAKKELRFSTTFFNQGKGPLEIIGHTDKEDNITYASQYAYEEGGPGVYRDMGTFVYHPAHSHWHVDQYVFYELWSVDSEGKPDNLLFTTDKMSFCIWDENSKDLGVEGAPQARAYPRTCNGRQQGMSVGWSDTYQANIEGQGVDVTNVGDGTYIFRTIINPDRKILETDYDNNTVDITIEIKGTSLVRK